MKWCWMLVSNYGVAIILFTLATKIILLPLSIWIQKNSILMVKIQPEINFLKVRLHGNMDAIAEEQAKLFKREKYHPMLSIIPLVLQLVLLLCVVEIIYNPMTYLFGIATSDINALATFINANMESSSFQLAIIEAIKDGTITVAKTDEIGISQQTLANIIEVSKSFEFSFLGIDLAKVPSVVGGWYVLVPIVAGLSSYVMCWTQNISNVLQKEQSNLNKYGIMILSVALSLYLGIFVPVGIALYWIASNLMSIAQMYLLNWAINPKNYVDYEALEESRRQLENLNNVGKVDKKDPKYRQNKQREKKDYKRFMNIVNKHVVFYSEKSGFYKYYKDTIEQLLKKSNLTIHYVTNDPDDIIFEIANEEPRIKPYYIGLKKMITLMMWVQADIFVMTTPDLNKFYLKRSFVQKDIEYIYIPHDMMSIHLGFREGAFDAFDTIFCVGPHQKLEHQKTEEVYSLPKKNLVEFGYPLADLLVKAGEEEKQKQGDKKSQKKEILIAPSWNEDNLLDSCVDKLIDKLYQEEYHITVRPHPEYKKRFESKLNDLVERYKDYDSDKLTFELDFSTNKSTYASDLLITDWSGIAPEFCFATKRPAIFVNTKLKLLNENWENLSLTPVEISLRDELGVSIDKENLDSVDEVVKKLFDEGEKYSEQIENRFNTLVYNHFKAAECGATYILQSLIEKKKKQKENE